MMLDIVLATLGRLPSTCCMLSVDHRNEGSRHHKPKVAAISDQLDEGARRSRPPSPVPDGC